MKCPSPSPSVSKGLLSPGLHADEDDGTGVCFFQLRPVRAAESSSLWRRTEQGVGPGYKPLNKPRAFERQVHQRDSNIPQLSSVRASHSEQTLTAQTNHLAIFQVNVKHQLVWWSDSQKLTGGLNLITLERRANEIVAGATGVGRNVRHHLRTSGHLSWEPYKTPNTDPQASEDRVQ